MSFADKYFDLEISWSFHWDQWVRHVFRSELAALAALHSNDDMEAAHVLFRNAETHLLPKVRSLKPDEVPAGAHETVMLVERLMKAMRLEPAFAGLANMVHFGLTSSDVGDSAFSLMLKDTNTQLIDRISRLSEKLGRLSESLIGTNILGRTHGQFAEPISLGHRFGVMKSLIVDAASKFRGMVYFGKFTGSMGDYAHTTVEREVLACSLLGLQTPPGACGQCLPRQVFVDYAHPLLMLSVALEQISMNLRLMLRSEGELLLRKHHSEPHSSSMPHKTNPFELERVSGMMRINRALIGSIHENAGCLWEERDMSHSVVEKVTFETVYHNIGYSIDTVLRSLSRVSVNDATVEHHANLASDGRFDGQKRMHMAIKTGESRSDAYKEQM